VTHRVLDVAALEEGPVDSRSLLWWGNLAMIAIEGSMFVMALATYLYLKTANLDWPPSTVPKPELLLPTLNLAILLLIAIPAWISDRAAFRGDVRTALTAQTVCVIGGIAFLLIRAVNMAHLGYKWSDHAYGSVVWVILGLHSFHMLAVTLECSLLLVYARFGTVLKKHLLDLRCTAVYWYFVIAVWLPFYFVIYIEPWTRRKGS
jgi:cytochrome c oxidase subunit III